MSRKRIRLTEGELGKIVKESVRRVIKESVPDAYEFKPTFDDEETQKRFGADMREMLSTLDDERFMKYYFNRRLTFDDPDIVDAIWREYAKRQGIR